MTTSPSFFVTATATSTSTISAKLLMAATSTTSAKLLMAATATLSYPLFKTNSSNWSFLAIHTISPLFNTEFRSRKLASAALGTSEHTASIRHTP